MKKSEKRVAQCHFPPAPLPSDFWILDSEIWFLISTFSFPAARFTCIVPAYD
jgi:hypothetical protein